MNYTQTILAPKSTAQGLSSDHPLFYARHKNYFLSELSEKVALQSKLPTNQLKRNVKVGFYLQQYKELKAKIEKQKQVVLNSSEFRTIFVKNKTPQDQENIRKKKAQKLRERLYTGYMTPDQKDEEYEFKEMVQRQENTLADYRRDPERMKEIYLIDLQIQNLKEEERRQKNTSENRCLGSKILNKLSSSIISSYVVYFEEIFALLIDEILEQEITHFNHLEAEFHLKNDKISYQNVKIQSLKTLRMMELVQSLNDLCD